MNTNNPMNEKGPSHIVVNRILERSVYCNDIMDTAISLKEQIEQTQDENALLELNKKLQLLIDRQLKLKEYTISLHETFRTIPHRSERLQRASEHFYRGEFPEMDQALDDVAIFEEIDRLEEDFYKETDEERKEKLRIRLRRRSYELIVKALYRYTFVENPEWYKDVYRLLEKARDASFNVHTLYELAAYLRLTDELDWAFELLDDASVMADDLEGEACKLYKAKSFWAMGAIASKRKDYPKNIEHTGKALTLYTELSEQDPAEYREEVANMMSIIGDSHGLSDNFPVALLIFEEVAKIRRELSLLHGNPEYALHLADTLDKLAIVHTRLDENREAVECLEEALRIKDDNVDYNLYSLLESKANTLAKLV
ncbi:MAG: tetratricopeptide repeat protein, partial [Tannerella sp.]|nr:tetratricopeptide repeat protein [Tannerella sp.]